MSDLISRQKAIDMLNRGLSKIPYVNNTDEEMIRRDERIGCIQEIRELPSVPRKGKWLKAGTRMGIPLFECSLCECGEEVPTVMGKPSYNFCPNCGADMREGDSE